MSEETGDLFSNPEGPGINQPQQENDMSKAVATKGSAAVAIPMDDLVADAGAGGEEMRSEDIQIPTLVIVQKMSPQMEESSPAYNPNARPGMICDTLTGRLWDGDEGLAVVPVHFKPVVNHLQVDGDASTFLASYDVTDPLAQRRTERDDKGRDMVVDDPGTFLQNVAQHFVLLAEACEPFVIRMKRTGMRPSKRWNALLQGFQPLDVDGRKVPRPRFSIRCVLKTVKEEKDGKTWFGWAPEITGEVEDTSLYHAGRDLHHMLRAGTAVAAPEDEEGDPPF